MINIIIAIIAVLIFQFKCLRTFLSKLIGWQNKKLYVAILISVIITLCILSNNSFSDKDFDINYFLNLSLIILYGLIIFYYFKEKQKSDKLSSRYDQMLNCVSKYEKEITKNRMNIHEFKNQIITIKGLIPGKDKEVHKYIESIILESKTNNSKMLNELEKIPNGGLKGLIYYKLGDLSDEGIQVFTNINNDSNASLKLNPEEYHNMLKVMGIYLDNAVDAIKTSLNKQIILEMDIKKHELSVVLSNTYNGKVDIEQINKSNFTTKGKGHGYGLLIARRVFDKYKNFSNKIEITNDLYTVYLSFKFKSISKK